MPDDIGSIVRRHLMIAGTGRAGTSFLVRYLTELGLDTHLARRGEDAFWHEDANAGLEELPAPHLRGELPYLVKSPWLYQFIDQILASGAFGMDAVIIPVRDLADAAISRCIVERRAAHRRAPWLTEADQTWEEVAHVPGGAIFSLNPLDQGRLLAVSFHHLVQRLIAADIPIVLLDFPRMVEDPDYLFEKLRALLPETTTAEQARSAHRETAERDLVHVGAERRGAQAAALIRYEDADTLDAIAARRELSLVRRQLEDAAAAAAAFADDARVSLAAASATAAHDQQRLTLCRQALEDEARLRQHDAQVHRDDLRAREQERLERTQRHEAELARLHAAARQAEARAIGLQDRLDAIGMSTSWRLTQPYRVVGNWLKHGASRGRR